MSVCEKLKQLKVSIISLDLTAIESNCERVISQQELLKMYQRSGITIDELADTFFVSRETFQKWLYLSPNNRQGLKEPMRTKVVKYLRCCH